MPRKLSLIRKRMVRPPEDLDLNRRIDNDKPSETMKAAIQAALMLGQPAAQIAQQFGLPPATVRGWEAAYDISNPIKRRDHLSEMLLVFVEQEIANLMAISIATSDERWIKAQSATELATFTSVKQDRLMRIFEAFGKAQQSRQEIAGEITSEDIDDSNYDSSA